MKTTTLVSVRPNTLANIGSMCRRINFSLIRSLSGLSPVRVLAVIFSEIMDELVTPRQALCIVNALLALLLTVFSLAVPMFFRLLCVAWLFVALRQCKREGLGSE